MREVKIFSIFILKIEMNCLEKRIKDLLANRPKVTPAEPHLKKAAVLLPLFKHDDEYYFLLTKRTNQVAHHKGEISFPGGKQDPGENLLHTALREAKEELGIHEKDVIILGDLDDMFTLSSDFLISPFVGLIPYPYPFKINTKEISEIIAIPLSALANPASWHQELRERDGHPQPVYFFQYQGHLIWGATARILKQFIDLILGKGED